MKHCDRWTFFVCLLALIFVASTATAQPEEIEEAAEEVADSMERIAIGGMVGLDITEFDLGLFLGPDARFTFDIAENIGVSANPAITYYLPVGDDWDLPDEVSAHAFQVDLNGLVHYGLGEDLNIYGGLGLGFIHQRISFEDFQGEQQTESDTEVGFNLLGGAEFSLDAPVTPFAQFRLSTAPDGLPGRSSSFSIMGGVLYEL